MIKQVTNDKLINGGTIIVVPKVVYEVPLEMADMENVNEETGETSYHSIKSLEAEHSHWKPSDLKINGNEYLKFHYCLDDDASERPMLRAGFESKGLVNGRTGKVEDIDFSEWKGNEYLICSHREIKIVIANQDANGEMM
jgi:hypothetical protein